MTDGFINLLKPPGMTSHDAVSLMRKILNIKKIGHTGTLDPGVAGVLPLCVGKATRLAEYVTNRPKSYRAEITFGLSTDSQDAYGHVERESACTDLRFEQFLDLIPSFVGEIRQIPPMVSAGRIGGTRLYQLAREGIEVERRPKLIFIYKIAVFQSHWHLPNPSVIFDVVCSKGTYIRTLCHDMGEKLGVGAYLSFLIRTQSGPFKIEDSLTIEEITRLAGKNNLSFVRPMQEGILFFPPITVSDDQANAVLHGNSFILPGSEFREDRLYRVENQENRLLAVGHAIHTTEGVFIFKPEKVFG
ncbi:tRNA pseudouridine(55) synthase TruB [Candidatus Formimonas warabiya]|uniref:tRNA pseudouridine synthase B n=1 Tax=Formimonas warabiya TaxID=1761012 RepID=A0A3G1KP24_FORW1|nr:tRNA pseudouridine(55) synthase TruB [Candidatus Formimonas warabiya]ATW24208.1 tRNA pseudouridine(55) synthase TruB [Candidatus Formimonas warabiya]